MVSKLGFIKKVFSGKITSKYYSNKIFTSTVFQRNLCDYIEKSYSCIFSYPKWIKLDSLFKHWLVCNQQYQEDCWMLQKSLLFKYEDFTSKPNEVLLQISELLGDSLELKKEWDVKQGVNQKYMEIWERYKNSFWTRRKAQKLILKYEDSFNTFGYSLK